MKKLVRIFKKLPSFLLISSYNLYINPIQPSVALQIETSHCFTLQNNICFTLQDWFLYEMQHLTEIGEVAINRIQKTILTNTFGDSLL